jgi:hypothetical protein
MVAAFAIGNALLGLYLMWLLMRDEPGDAQVSTLSGSCRP